jgi:hypothetical protein
MTTVTASVQSTSQSGGATLLSLPLSGQAPQVSLVTNLTKAQVNELKSMLPQHCSISNAEQQATLVVCNTSSEGFWTKLAPNVPSITMSLIAVVLSGISLYYTLRKDSRARKQSIQDDFWLRKVVSPVSIEPLVKFGSDLLAHLPDSTTLSSDGKEFGSLKLPELRRITAAFHSLRLIDEKLHSEVINALEQFEDRLATYLGQLNSHWETGAVAPSRPEAVEDMSSKLMQVLKPIKNHQAAVGYNE